MRITAYDIHNTATPVEPMLSHRAWMEETGDRFAYRCLPMTMANACGWQLLCPGSFTAIWSGGRQKADLQVILDPGCPPFAVSHFGTGVLTFHTGYLFRTPADVNLWVRGPANSPKARIQALEGIVEADWSHATFTMNWIFTESGEVRFEKGDPFCAILPYPRFYIEQFDGQVTSLAEHADVKARFETWKASRREFLDNLPNPEHEANKQGWQRDYMLGKVDETGAFAAHQTKLTLKPFAGQRAAAISGGKSPKRSRKKPAARGANRSLPGQGDRLNSSFLCSTSVTVSAAVPLASAERCGQVSIDTTSQGRSKTK